MIAAALYARYSTDNQRQTSIDGQLALGRERAAREAWPIGDGCVYADKETSGYTPIELRPGSSRLMLDAAAGKFQILILEGLDRFSRNLVDQERMVRRLEHRGVRIIGCTDGYDTSLAGRELSRQVRGSFNEQYLRDVARETHRGLTLRVGNGFHAGGISYGYRSELAGVDGAGDPIGYRLLVDDAKAGVVRWIFEQYAQGWSCQRIAADLNARTVPAPRSGTWVVSALYGSRDKGSGVLNNEIYIGRYIWNRSRWTKDPDTGKRHRADRPRTEWRIREAPQLAIVPPELWQRVRTRMDRPRLAGGGRGKGAQPRTLFGGLVACGRCGGAVVAVSRHSYGCAARKDRGRPVCIGVLVPRRQLDARLLSLVRDTLLSPEAVSAVQADAGRILAESQRESLQAVARTRGRLAVLEAEIARLVDAVAKVGHSDALQARLQAAEQEKAVLLATRLPAIPAGAIPALVAGYKRMVADLQRALGEDVPRARSLLQSALGAIKLVPEGKDVYAEVETNAGRLLLAAGGSTLEMVAGTCFVTRKRIRVR